MCTLALPFPSHVTYLSSSTPPASDHGFVHRLVTVLTCLRADTFYSATTLSQPSLPQTQLSHPGLNDGLCHISFGHLTSTSSCSASLVQSWHCHLVLSWLGHRAQTGHFCLLHITFPCGRMLTFTPGGSNKLISSYPPTQDKTNLKVKKNMKKANVQDSALEEGTNI